MRFRLTMAPWWVQGLVMGVFFGAFMALFSLADSDPQPWWEVLVRSVISGLLFGVSMGLTVGRQNLRLSGDLVPFSVEERSVVLKATKRRGRIPEDDQLRAAAQSLLERQRLYYERARPLGLWFFPGGMVLYVALAIMQSPWWILGTVLFAGFWVVTLRSRRHFAERRAALADASPHSDASRVAEQPN